ncbi:glycosyltransferase CAZy family GT34-like protein [Selaginella moellendorffii]|uniref:Glycosyltransferase CAZy family GT34-like protein n=1 Tax=Selaginella moellendorffii TaxID=88036 RepID=D8R576_SELML|nr:xyloglucan 6-xylosyltransferase 1 [Selaginella moellendorffii]EFJ32439.1 glycosyltransferase CAZy family GT34-like protein [Selaginella moellendorffii]|eukprot:XP_002966412.1 xyloglucan 6-xylosyltransferase 1 [Selaginella moellendorffii]
MANSPPALLAGLLLVAACFLIVVLLLTTLQDTTIDHPSRSLSKSSKHDAAAADRPAPLIIASAHSDLYSRMRMLKSLKQAPPEPLKFLLVTADQPTSCKTRQGSHLLMMSLKNKVDYCNLHQCKVWYSLESWQPGFTGTWARYPLLQRLMLVNSHVEWFMWMDSDALFTDMSFVIPLETYESWNKDMIIPGYWEKVYGDDPDWLGLNAGIFLIRNTEWSRNFLDKWMSFRPDSPQRSHHLTEILNREFRTRPRNWPADDQSALAYLLRRNKTEHERRTYLEAGYALHGFWEVIVDGFEEMAARGNVGDRQKWPFVTHFCGCKLCTGEYATSQSARCVESFRRAYNFGDNQVLALAGMAHPDLSSLEVVESSALL